MIIVDLDPAAAARVGQTARLLFDVFRARSAGWPDLAAAEREVLESLAPERISRVALDDAGNVVGWVGGLPQYHGNVWELHPLAVARSHRGRGLGRALVADLERAVVERGALTLWLGSDDELGETSLAGSDLYERLPDALRDPRGGGEHALGFYLHIGFRLVGVMPDANGRGRPDLYLAKRVGRTAP